MSRYALNQLIFVGLVGVSVLNAKDVRQTIKEETAKLFTEKLDVHKNELNISFNNFPDNLDKYKNKHIEVYSQKNSLRPGTQSVWVRFTDGYNVVKKIPLNISVLVEKDVVVSTQRINRNNGLSNTNLKLETRRLGKDWDQYFFSLKELTDSESKRQIKKGTALTKRMIQATQLVHSGQSVRVELQRGNLTVATNGIAKQNGAYGQRIKLKLDKTGKTIRGIVSAENLVIVSQE